MQSKKDPSKINRAAAAIDRTILASTYMDDNGVKGYNKRQVARVAQRLG